VRSTAAPYTESRLTRSVANERVGFPVVEQLQYFIRAGQYCTVFHRSSTIFHRSSTILISHGLPVPQKCVLPKGKNSNKNNKKTT
jgi:hypothetical protein